MKNKKITTFAFTPPISTEAGYKQYADCGFDMAIIDPSVPYGSDEYLQFFKWCDKFGMNAIPMCVNWDKGVENGGPCEFPRTYDKTDYTQFKSFVGAYMADEPEMKTWDKLLENMQRFEKFYPGKFAYVNLSANYCAKELLDKFPLDSEGYGHDCARGTVDAFCDTVLNKIQGEKILSFDYYPLKIMEDGRNVLIHDWLWAYDFYSVKARDYGYTAWVFIQTTGAKNHEYIRARELKSPADYRFQSSIALAYGFSGIGSFCYQSFFKPYKALIMDGEPTEGYYYVQKVNKELHKFSPLYERYSWKCAGLNVGIDTRDYAQTCLKRMINNVTNYDKIKLEKTESDLVIGEFVKDESKQYAYMLVNYVEPSEKKRNYITISFKEPTTSVNVWRRGVKKERKVVGNKLKLIVSTGDYAFVEIIK